MLSFSRILAVCFLSLILGGCGLRSLHPEDEKASALLHVQILSRNYGELNSPFYRDYLEYLERRLSLAAAGRERKALFPYHFILLNSSEPFAFSAGAGFVLISKALVLSLKSEAELAFVLAHELSHQKLGHTTNYNSNLDYDAIVPGLGQGNWQKDAEYEADLSALGIMAFAGYDPNAAIGALLNAYRFAGEKGENQTHPRLDARIQAVRVAIQDSKWQPPGTINRRAFSKLRRSLLHS